MARGQTVGGRYGGEGRRSEAIWIWTPATFRDRGATAGGEGGIGRKHACLMEHSHSLLIFSQRAHVGDCYGQMITLGRR